MNIGLHKITDSKPTIPPRVALSIPLHWSIIAIDDGLGKAFHNDISGLIVLASTDTMADGKQYLHVSCSYKDRLPSWDDLKSVKEIFIGDDREAVQVLPRKTDYVNVHPYCLHLFAEEV